MRRIDCGTSGSATQRMQLRWQDLHLDHPWPEVIDILSPGTAPRMIQAQALGKHRLFASRRHLILSAPTNSGKTLVGLLALLEAIQRGRRAILLEPLRALARERMAWLDTITPHLGYALGCQLSVRISTGDYRRDDETFAAPPPAAR